MMLSDPGWQLLDPEVSADELQLCEFLLRDGPEPWEQPAQLVGLQQVSCAQSLALSSNETGAACTARGGSSSRQPRRSGAGQLVCLRLPHGHCRSSPRPGRARHGRREEGEAAPQEPGGHAPLQGQAKGGCPPRLRQPP